MATEPELVNAEKVKELFELIAGFQTLMIIYSVFFVKLEKLPTT